MSYRGEIINYGDPDDLIPGSGFNQTVMTPTIIHSPYILCFLLLISGIYFNLNWKYVSFVTNHFTVGNHNAKLMVTLIMNN